MLMITSCSYTHQCDFVENSSFSRVLIHKAWLSTVLSYLASLIELRAYHCAIGSVIRSALKPAQRLWTREDWFSMHLTKMYCRQTLILLRDLKVFLVYFMMICCDITSATFVHDVSQSLLPFLCYLRVMLVWLAVYLS